MSGGPPKPPKITSRGLDDGAPEENKPDLEAFLQFRHAMRQSDRIVELLGYLRDSRLAVAVNKLEADLDACIVELDKGNRLGAAGFDLIAKHHLETILAYRDRYLRHATGDRELREQARKILDRVKKKKSLEI